jgi:hypothetical protein
MIWEELIDINIMRTDAVDAVREVVTKKSFSYDRSRKSLSLKGIYDAYDSYVHNDHNSVVVDCIRSDIERQYGIFISPNDFHKEISIGMATKIVVKLLERNGMLYDYCDDNGHFKEISKITMWDLLDFD